MDEGDFSDDMADFERLYKDDLRISSGVGTRRVRGRICEDQMLVELLQQANSAYVMQDYNLAKQKCEQLIKIHPKAYKAYRILGLIAEENNEMRRALSMYMMMRHMMPKEKDCFLWRSLAVFARMYGNEREMLHCYRKSCFSNQDTIVPWKLICYYDQNGQLSNQIDYLKILLRQLPHNMIMVRRLVTVYEAKKKLKEAAVLLLDALMYHSSGLFDSPWIIPSDEEMEEQVTQEPCTFFERVVFQSREGRSDAVVTPETGAMDLEDLYLATKLLLHEQMYSALLVLVKRFFRFAHGRMMEGAMFGDELVSDAEYDPDFCPRELTVYHNSRPLDGLSGLPLDFRVCLGVCRLGMNHFSIAQAHFSILLNFEIRNTPDLYEQMLDSLMHHEYYQETLNLIENFLQKQKDFPHLWFRKGICEQKLGLNAIDSFEKVLMLDPASVESREQLAEIYTNLGDKERAFEMLRDADKALILENYDEPVCKKTQSDNEDEEEEEKEADALLVDLVKPHVSEKQRLERTMKRKDATVQKQHEVKLKFEKMAFILYQYDDLKDKQQEYESTLESIFQIFCSTGAFYPDKTDYKIIEGRTSLAPQANYAPEDAKNFQRKVVQATYYLGYTLDRWFELLMEYAVVLAKTKKYEESLKSIQQVMSSNVFWNDQQRVQKSTIISVSVCLRGKLYSRASYLARTLIHGDSYSMGPYHVYQVAFADIEPRLAYGSLCSQKFFRRLLVSRFRGTLRSHMTPMEVEKYGKAPCLPVKDNPELIWKSKIQALMIYGHIMNCATSYNPAFAHYIRAFALGPEDPSINFSIGLSLLHKCMTRICPNRHLTFSQSLAFLLRYSNLAKQPKTLIQYNLGRAFHQVGLLNLAVTYYHRAIEAADSDHLLEAAYNLHLIYINTNAHELAKDIMKRYLTF